MQWVPDPPLKQDRAAALIRNYFPSVDAATLRYLGSGWQFDAFLTADEWVFRFPRWEWSGELFESEARVHRFAAQILPPQIRIPKVELLAAPTAQFPYPFAGHRFIPGVGGDTLDEKLLPTLANDVAMFLSALHSTPPPVAGAAGIREIPLNDPGRRDWLEHGIAAAAQLRELDSVVEQAVEWLGRASITPPSLGGTLQLIHGGLAPEHLIVDPSTGALIGVIDWTDAQLGDAARDFVFLVTWRGWKFVEDVLRIYPRAVDREFRTRLRYMAQMLSVIWLAFAYEQGADLTKHVQAVHNAFAPNETP
jgi:aminoglycoside phosphotransferase (APT) family kinase protein